jgi:gliding motility-associated-like protein
MGVFTIRLTVISNGGCRDTVSTTVTVFETPVAAFSSVVVCQGVPTDFTNSSTISSGSLTYNWNFGDGNSSTAEAPSYIFGTYGDINVTLTAISSDGCENSITLAAHVYPKPNAFFNLNDVCEGTPVNFHDESTVPNGFVITWNWYFGDSVYSLQRNTAHTYSGFGLYTATLAVSTNHGCTGEYQLPVNVYAKPVPDFMCSDVCFGYISTFTEASGIADGNITEWHWNFGDGTASTDTVPVHFYDRPGTYTVSLSVTSDHGCISDLVHAGGVTIYPLPVAGFTSNVIEADEMYPVVHFYNATGSEGMYTWQFGDGGTSHDYSPDHTYPGVGIYDIELAVIDGYGCVDTTYGRLEIKPTSTFFVPNCFTPNKDELNQKFRPFFTNIVTIDGVIFDRWGLKIYEWNNLEGGWDGYYDGNPAQADVYVYRIKTTDINNKAATHIGHVSLVR